jgi:hypothetical protein
MVFVAKIRLARKNRGPFSDSVSDEEEKFYEVDTWCIIGYKAALSVTSRNIISYSLRNFPVKRIQ